VATAQVTDGTILYQPISINESRIAIRKKYGENYLLIVSGWGQQEIITPATHEYIYRRASKSC
jgi:hypothetical protein